MAKPGMQPISGRKPLTRKISGRSIAIALDGPEQPYPVYRFSRRNFFEKPKHNPFFGLQDPTIVEAFSSGFSGGFQ